MRAGLTLLAALAAGARPASASDATLVYEVEIRRVTHNRHSLGDALRAVLETCGDVSSDATIDAVLSAGDGAIGHPVLRELYERLAKQPGTVDLPALFRLLGVDASGGELRFDDAAPYAAIRKGIATDGRASPGGGTPQAATSAIGGP